MLIKFFLVLLKYFLLLAVGMYSFDYLQHYIRVPGAHYIKYLMFAVCFFFLQRDAYPLLNRVLNNQSKGDI